MLRTYPDQPPHPEPATMSESTVAILLVLHSGTSGWEVPSTTTTSEGRFGSRMSGLSADSEDWSLSSRSEVRRLRTGSEVCGLSTCFGGE